MGRVERLRGWQRTTNSQKFATRRSIRDVVSGSRRRFSHINTDRFFFFVYSWIKKHGFWIIADEITTIRRAYDARREANRDILRSYTGPCQFVQASFARYETHPSRDRAEGRLMQFHGVSAARRGRATTLRRYAETRVPGATCGRLRGNVYSSRRAPDVSVGILHYRRPVYARF